jgi:phage repressor protein C with HTH and peptisase S24 domain
MADFDSFFKRLKGDGRVASQKELASVLGIDNSAVSQAKRRNSVPINWIRKISEQFELNPEWLESGVGKKDLNGGKAGGTEFDIVPKVKARLSAGGGSFEVEPDIEGYYSFQRQWLLQKGNPRKMVLMDVSGNSMEPEIRDGDTALIDLSRTEILAGAIYAIGVDDTVMVKRVEKLPDKLVLISDNKRYDPVYLQGNEIISVRILGKVIWICRELK